MKNYGELSGIIFKEIDGNIEKITEVLVGDTYSPASTVIKIDLKSLLHKAIMAQLGELGSVNNSDYNRDGYEDGLAIDLKEVKIAIDNERMVVYVTRD